MNRKCEIPETVKIYMRSVLLSKIGGILLTDIEHDYRICCQEELNYQKYGFPTLEDFLLAMPDVAKVVDRCGGKRVFGLGIENFLCVNITAAKAVYKPINDAAPQNGNSQEPQRVFIGNLPSDTTENMLRQHFFGYEFSNLELRSINGKKIAYLETSFHYAKQMCAEKNQSKLNQYSIIVDMAKRKPLSDNSNYSQIPSQNVDSPNSNELMFEVICSRRKRPSNNMTNNGGDYPMSSNEDTEFHSGSSAMRIEGMDDSLLNGMSGSVFPLKPSRNEETVQERSSSTEIPDQIFENDGILGFAGFSDEIPELLDDRLIKTWKSESGSSLCSSDHGPQMTKPVTYDAYVSSLDYHASKEAIMLLFSSCDPIDVVMVNPNNKNEIDYTKVGHCYVKFRTIEDLLRAVDSCQGKKINERAIKVRFANSSSVAVKEYLSDASVATKEYFTRQTFELNEQHVSKMYEQIQDHSNDHLSAVCESVHPNSKRHTYQHDHTFTMLGCSSKPDYYSSLLHPSSKTRYSTRDGETLMSPEFQLFNDPLVDDNPSSIMNESDFKKMLAETCSVGSLITSLDLPDNIQILVSFPDPMDCKYFWGVLAFGPHLQHLEHVYKFMTPEFEIISSTLTVADFGVKRGVAMFEYEWCRVWIKSWSAQTAVVFFIDYGNTETIPRNDVYDLPDRFWSTPPCAIPFKLSQHFDVVSCVNQSIAAVVKRPGRRNHIVEISVIVNSV